jgi:hypothetical protein
MTASAWIMMLTTFSIVTFFTARFFLRILRLPAKGDSGGGETNSDKG